MPIEYIGAIENAIKKRIEDQLKSAVDQVKRDSLVIDCFPGDFTEYTNRPVAKTLAMIRYRGGAFENIEYCQGEEGKAFLNQSHAMIFEIQVAGKAVRDHQGCYEWLALLREFLNGFEPVPESPGRKLECDSQNYLGQLESFFIFSQTYSLVLDDQEAT